MFLNSKTLLFILLISTLGFSQDTETQIETETQMEETPSRKFGNISIGAYVPIAFGDNFVSNGMDLNTGVKFSFKVHIVDNIYVGNYISIFNGTVTEPEEIGNYDNMANYVLGGIVGYELEVQKFDIFLGLGVGYSIYNNKGLGDTFNDTATAVWFNPEISYSFSKYWAVFVAPELRRDFMNIEVPQQLESSFKNVDYLNVGFGIRLNIGGN